MIDGVPVSVTFRRVLHSVLEGCIVTLVVCGQADCSSQNIVFSPKLAAEAGDIDAIPELEEQACLICAEPITYFMIGTLPLDCSQTAHERWQENVTTGKPVPFACSV